VWYDGPRYPFQHSTAPESQWLTGCAWCACRARKEAAEGAEVARQESVAALKAELAELKVRTNLCEEGLLGLTREIASPQAPGGRVCCPSRHVLVELNCQRLASQCRTVYACLAPDWHHCYHCHCCVAAGSPSYPACRKRMPASCQASKRPQHASWHSSSRQLTQLSRSWRVQLSACRTSWQLRWSALTATAGNCSGGCNMWC
jgi:hypothetical protein